MTAFLLRRFLVALPTLLIITILTFFLLRFAPGGPFDSEHAWPPEVKANIAHRYELDLPVSIQFLHWIRNILKGDMGESFQYINRPVAAIISESLPISALIGVLSLSLAILIGIPLGSLSAWKANTAIDHLINFLSVLNIIFPVYLAASLLILVFALHLGWFPPGLSEGPCSWILPAITLGLRPLGLVARITRTAMIEALRSDYIRTAMGKGLGPAQLIFKHALRNSLIPLLGLLGPITANLLTGSFAVELIFQIPGLGNHFVQAVINRDYPLVMGVTLTYAVALLISNGVVDALSAWVDPRIRSLTTIGFT